MTGPPGVVVVLYGATGDLAHRKLFPALAELAAAGLLPERWQVVASGRSPVAGFAGQVEASVRRAGYPAPVARAVAAGVSYAAGDVAAGETVALAEALAAARAAVGPASVTAHVLSVPPDAFAPLTAALGRHQLVDDRARVVYDKPFGTSLATFRPLQRLVRRTFADDQVFRIDHFLSKEAVRHLQVVRFANAVFARMWDHRSIRAVQIDVPEQLGVGDRGDFYDRTGAVRDMVATHLFQVAAEVAMEPPRGRTPADLARAREAVLARLRVLDPSEVVLGQFDGYRDVPGVRRGSRTPTFAAARLWIDTPRWRGVPFLLRTGKRLHHSAQAVTLLLRRPAGPFADVAADAEAVVIDLDGPGRLGLRLATKAPGLDERLVVTDAELALGDAGPGEPLDAYARVLHDVITGDRSRATRPDGLAHVWRVVDPVLALDRRPLPYAPGSWGPAAAGRLAPPDGWALGG